MKRLPRNNAKMIGSPNKKVPARRNQIRRSSPTRGLASESGATAKSSSHWLLKFLFAVYVLAIIWTSLAYAAEHGITESPVAASVGLLRTTPRPNRRVRLTAYVRSAAEVAGVNPRVAQWVVSHESQYHPEATGDGGESRGLWQINRFYHPEVSDECAYDAECSTDWALQRILDGKINEWTTWKYCRAWFEDCPF